MGGWMDICWAGCRRGWTVARMLAGLLVVVLLATLGFYVLEGPSRLSLSDALWWAVVTLSTVGYGDVVPTTAGGRVMAAVVMVGGVGVLSVVTGQLASSIMDYRARKRKGLLAVDVSQHVVLMGWNAFGPELLGALQASQVVGRGRAAVVIVTTLPQEEREAIAFRLDLGDSLHFVYGSPAHEGIVHKARPAWAKLVYLLARDDISAAEADQQTLCAALAVRELAPSVPLYAEAMTPEGRKNLMRAGVDHVLVRGELETRILGIMGSYAAMGTVLEQMVGAGGDSLLAWRSLAAEEKTMTWGEFFASARRRGELPVALCRMSRSLCLENILDESSALDQFIIELFHSSGQKTALGMAGPQVVTNPEDALFLDSFDAVVFLRPHN